MKILTEIGKTRLSVYFVVLAQWFSIFFPPENILEIFRNMFVNGYFFLRD